MLLSDRDIRAEIDSGGLVIEPYTPELLQPASIDIRLDRQLLTAWDEIRDMGITGYEMLPGDFLLGSTLERFRIGEHLAARIEGKSTLGRRGLMTHATAGWVDPGFQGTLTLELHHVGVYNFLLHPGMLIGQVCFFRLSSPAEYPYNGRYQGQAGPTAARQA